MTGGKGTLNEIEQPQQLRHLYLSAAHRSFLKRLGFNHTITTQSHREELLLTIAKKALFQGLRHCASAFDLLTFHLLSEPAGNRAESGNTASRNRGTIIYFLRNSRIRNKK